MCWFYGEGWARVCRGTAVLSLAWCTLNVACHSISYATFFDDYSSPVVDIWVRDYAGEVSVRDEFIGPGEDDLPTLVIREKIFQRDDETRFWVDVEVKVKVYVDQHHDWRDWNDNTYSSSSDFRWWWDDEPEEHPEDPQRPKDVVIGIDKFVKNRTGVLWRDFRIVLGTGVGDEFMPSDSLDKLLFVLDPRPKEVTSFYDDPPQHDSPTSDSLLWTSKNSPGQGNRDRSSFWFGVKIPEELFRPHPRHDGYWTAKFTIRQHTGVPEPQTMTLALGGVMGAWLGRPRRRLRLSKAD